MKVLVFGATGFIGHEAALALLRAGHTVIGATRSAESAKRLEAEEITPKLCDPLDASTYASVIATVDAVIDCSGGSELAKAGHLILDTTIAEAAKTRPKGPPLSYIYCSGTWVHGDNAVDIISDRTPLNSPMPLTSWRLGIEEKACSAISPSFTGNVIRPSLLYGGSASSLHSLFDNAKKGTIQWKGTDQTRLALIHRADLGEAFRLCAEKSYAIPGIKFDISNDYPESLAYILAQLQRVSGATSIEYSKPESPFEIALNASAVLRPELARDLLGWRPRRAPLGEGMETYYKAWLASNA